jgi:hypothetical protein
LAASSRSAPRDLPLALADVHGDPDRARLVGQAALDRLPDPEGRVRRELVALAPVELLGGADQPEDALLDQVEERELLALVLLRDRDDEPQVRVDHALLRPEVALLDPLRELDLLVGRQERIAPDLVEEELEGIGGRHRQLAVPERRGLHPGAPAVVAQFDAVRLHVRLQRDDVVVSELEGLHQLVELRQVDATALVAAGDQRSHLRA